MVLMLPRGENERANVLQLIRRAIGGLRGEWNTIVSVRTFDAKKSRRLLELFPEPNANAGSAEAACRQFLVPKLDMAEVEQARNQMRRAHAGDAGGGGGFQQPTDIAYLTGKSRLRSGNRWRDQACGQHRLRDEGVFPSRNPGKGPGGLEPRNRNHADCGAQRMEICRGGGDGFCSGPAEGPVFSGEFNQVILNLVVNAAHAIHDVVRQVEGRKGRSGFPRG